VTGVPFVQIRLLAGRSAAEKAELGAGVTAAVTGTLGVSPDDVTAVLAETAAEDWIVAGGPARPPGKRPAPSAAGERHGEI
jgi:4-oxalocrotonate tautomerase